MPKCYRLKQRWAKLPSITEGQAVFDARRDMSAVPYTVPRQERRRPRSSGITSTSASTPPLMDNTQDQHIPELDVTLVETPPKKFPGMVVSATFSLDRWSDDFSDHTRSSSERDTSLVVLSQHIAAPWYVLDVHGPPVYRTLTWRLQQRLVCCPRFVASKPDQVLFVVSPVPSSRSLCHGQPHCCRYSIPITAEGLESHTFLHARLLAQAYSLPAETWQTELLQTIRSKSEIFRVLLYIDEARARLHKADTHSLTVDKASCHNALTAYETEMLSLIPCIHDEQIGPGSIVTVDTPVESYFDPRRSALDGVDTRNSDLSCSTVETTTPIGSPVAAVGIAPSPAAEAKHKTLEGWTWVGHVAGSFETFVFVYCLFWRASFANPA